MKLRNLPSMLTPFRPLIVSLMLLSCAMTQVITHDPIFLALADASEQIHQAHPSSKIEEIIHRISAAEIEKNLRTLVGFGTRHSLSDTVSETRGIGAARRWIYHTLQHYGRASGGKLQVEMDRFAAKGRRLRGPTEMVNIVATLPAIHSTAQNRIYVVTGHYDSRNSDAMDGEGDAPGANDDGSGTVVVMELARVMSQFDFDATLVFITVVAEEQGLYGSRHWADEARRHGRNIAGMITNDVVGGGRGGNGVLDLNTLRCFSADPVDSPHREFARFTAEHIKAYLPDFSLQLIFRADRYGRGGDHMSFMRAGYPAIRFTEANENYDHQHQTVREEGGKVYGDLIEFVNFDYIANVARANAITLAALATGPAPPPHVSITGAVSHDTHLSWDESEEAVSYEVLLRETTAPFWQKAVPVLTGAEARLKGISIDNYFFGVRSVDPRGFVSTVAVPTED